MFNPDFQLDVPTGGDLLTEIGLDPRAISEVIEDDRAMRCPDRGAVFPERRLADLFPGNVPTGGAVEWRRASGG